MSRKKPDHECFRTPPVSLEEHRALYALGQGVASDIQQQLAVSVIIKKLARAFDMPYHPGSDRETSVLIGRYHVGQSLLRYVKNPPTEKSNE